MQRLSPHLDTNRQTDRQTPNTQETTQRNVFHKENIPNSSTQETHYNDTQAENTRSDLEIPKRNTSPEQVIQPKKYI